MSKNILMMIVIIFITIDFINFALFFNNKKNIEIIDNRLGKLETKSSVSNIEKRLTKLESNAAAIRNALKATSKAIPEEITATEAKANLTRIANNPALKPRRSLGMQAIFR
jgi:hypothetical protein